MNQALLEFIRETVTPENMKLQEPMAAHTTFRTGGEAAVFVEVPESSSLRSLYSIWQKSHRSFLYLEKAAICL